MRAIEADHVHMNAWLFDALRQIIKNVTGATLVDEI